MKHKILIDTISLLSPLTGIGRYTYEIARAIGDKQDLDSNYFYGYHSNKLLEPSTNVGMRNFKSLIAKNQFVKKIARKALIISNKLFTPSYDIYWQPNFIPDDSIQAKKIITSVHDFSFILHKNFHPKERIEHFEKYFFKNIINSDFIITGSKFSKKEILERLNFKDEHIKVIYHGINHGLFKVYDDVNISFELPKKFIFSVGSIEPRKNLIGLLKAYTQLNEKIKDKYNLVLVGFKGWENEEIIKLIEENKENIHYLGFISDKELAKVYNLSSLFVYPSFYEGFGLPVLEAMACGTPVVTSNVTSLPEVGGDAVVYCNPYSVEDIKVKIELVLGDKNLQKTMIKKGLIRAKEFSWEKSANEHIEVFNEVMKN